MSISSKKSSSRLVARKQVKSGSATASQFMIGWADLHKRPMNVSMEAGLRLSILSSG